MDVLKMIELKEGQDLPDGTYLVLNKDRELAVLEGFHFSLYPEIGLAWSGSNDYYECDITHYLPISIDEKNIIKLS